jgi:putative MFS transporter
MVTGQVSESQGQPLWKNKLWFLGALGFFFDALDIGIFSFAIAAIAQDWGLSQAETGLLGSVNSIGMAIGAIAAGWLADRYGRRWIFLGTLLIFSLGSMAGVLATTLSVMLIIRFIVGLGLGGELPIASTYVSETAPPHARGRAVVLAESFWAVGWMAAAIISFFFIPEYGWRAGFLLAGIPALYALFLRRNLPESRRYSEAVKQSGTKATMNHLFSKELSRGTITLWVLWFCINFAYYGMFLWLPSIMVSKGFSLVKSFQYVMFMTLVQLPGYVTAAWLIERIGRKWVLAIFLTGTAISAYGFGWAEYTTTLLTFGALLNFFNLGAWGALYAYTPELYPTTLRARGAGLAAGIGRIGAILAPYTVGLLLQAEFSTGQVFLLFFSLLLIAGLVISTVGPETKGKSL